MAGINTAGVIKGGLVAGLLMNVSETILNVPVAGARLEAELAAHNLPPVAGAAVGVFVVMTFVLGVLTIWLYAAIRPRLGPGPRTAICAGLFVWTVWYLYAGIAFGVMGINSWGLVGLGIVWSLIEMIVASVAGAYFYNE